MLAYLPFICIPCWFLQNCLLITHFSLLPELLMLKVLSRLFVLLCIQWEPRGNSWHPTGECFDDVRMDLYDYNPSHSIGTLCTTLGTITITTAPPIRTTTIPTTKWQHTLLLWYTMSAFFDFSSLILVILLLICTTTYLRELRPTIFDGGKVNVYVTWRWLILSAGIG